jgi:hypothetical protein
MPPAKPDVNYRRIVLNGLIAFQVIIRLPLKNKIPRKKK